MATNKFLPSPTGQRPRVDRARNLASVIPASPPKPPARCSPVGYPPTDPRGPVGARQAMTACWTIHLQMRFETSNIPMAIHQKGVSSIGTGKDLPF